MFRILIIDDDPITLMVMTRTLQRQGYQVETARNGREGLAKARQMIPSLIISDWMMPELSGIEVCRAIRQDPNLSLTFIILLTSRGGVDDRIRGLKAGADEFLSKPIEINELQARVQAGLRLHELSRDLQQQKQLLESELSEAADYVRSILPRSLGYPVVIDTCFFPSRQLGGDCFDFYWLDSDSLVVYLLDVSGHGLGAALPSVSVLNLLRSQAFAGVNYYRPADVLTALNRTFQMSDQHDKYFTIWYGVYQKSDGQLTYASAGHPPALLLSKQNEQVKVDRLKTRGLPIGMFLEAEYESQSLTIAPGSDLYIFSDGIYEICLPSGQVWGIDAFSQTLKTLKEKDQANIVHILETVQRATDTTSFEDDLSLVQVSF